MIRVKGEIRNYENIERDVVALMYKKMKVGGKRRSEVPIDIFYERRK